MYRYTILLLTAGLLIGCKSTVEPSGEQAANEAETTSQVEPFMGLPDDQEKLAETEEGDEYVAVTKVLPGHYDTYEYLTRTGQITAEQRRDGRIYFAIERKQEVGLIIVGDDTPRPTVPVSHRYRCKIPAGQPGFSADVPPDRVDDRIPYTDKALFANFAPECFALMCEGSIMGYRLDTYSSIEACVIWAAVRAMERDEATCTPFSEADASSQRMEEAVLEYAPSLRGMEEGEFSRTSVERRIWWPRPAFLPTEDEDTDFAVDTDRPVTPGHMMAAALAEFEFRNEAARLWRKPDEDYDTMQQRVRQMAKRLVEDGSFSAKPSLIGRGQIPASKKELYERACRKAAFLGVHMIRDLLVEVAEIEMGVSPKSPDEQADILRAWDDQVANITRVIDERGVAASLMCFPGPHPWVASAAEVMGLETGLTDADLADEESLETIVAALTSEDVAERRAAAWDLVRLGGVASAKAMDVARSLQDGDVTVRKFAAWAFQRIVVSAEDQPDIASALLAVLTEDADAEVRQAAARAFHEVGYVDETMIDGLMAALSNEDETTGWWAGYSLGQAKDHAEVIAPRLIALLKGDDLRQCAIAAQTLASMEDPPKEALPVLIELLESKDIKVRGTVLRALARIDPDCEVIVPTAMTMLAAEEADIRSGAADCLGRLGGRAAEAVPALIEALTDSGKYVPWSAGYALSQIGVTADEVPALLKLLKHASPETREAAARALNGASVPDKTDIVVALVPLFEDEETDVRSTAYSTLVGYGQDAAIALPRLRTMAEESHDGGARRYAKSAIEQIEASLDDSEAESSDE
ncbi:MAG: HEAT repeat domain-containing protein [Planctomycetota bacterium]|jgi:HEAT repeat protein